MTAILSQYEKPSTLTPERHQHQPETLAPFDASNIPATGFAFNTVVEQLVTVAKQAGVQRDDDAYPLGEIGGRHLTAEVVADETQNGEPMEVFRLAVASPEDKVRFYYFGSEVETKDGVVVDYKVHRESNGITQSVEFSSANHIMPAEEDTEMAQQLAETIIDVVNDKSTHEGIIDDDAITEIIAPLKSPEEPEHTTAKKWLGNTALKRLLSFFGNNRTV